VYGGFLVLALAPIALYVGFLPATCFTFTPVLTTYDDRFLDDIYERRCSPPDIPRIEV